MVLYMTSSQLLFSITFQSQVIFFPPPSSMPTSATSYKTPPHPPRIPWATWPVRIETRGQVYANILPIAVQLMWNHCDSSTRPCYVCVWMRHRLTPQKAWRGWCCMETQVTGKNNSLLNYRNTIVRKASLWKHHTNFLHQLFCREDNEDIPVFTVLLKVNLYCHSFSESLPSVYRPSKIISSVRDHIFDLICFLEGWPPSCTSI